MLKNDSDPDLGKMVTLTPIWMPKLESWLLNLAK